jgi:pyruvate kinase
MLLQPHSGDYPRATVGTIAEISERLHTELQLSGYSLLVDDVQDAMIEEARLYAAWATFEEQRFATLTISLNTSLKIDAYEWAFIKPVVLAHCDWLQAQRNEASRSLGVEAFGLSVSEARGNYDQQRDLLPKNAFIAPPFTLDAKP